MSLDDLTNSSPFQNDPDLPVKRRRSLTWLLPAGLFIGFLLILAFLFGDRLVPAIEVSVAPVVTLRAGEVEASPEEGSATGKGRLVFQASGWIEPDPYTTFVPSLINGVVAEVVVLEGESVRKGDLLATLIDDDARLSLREAEQKKRSMERRIVAHCVGLEIIKAELEAARRKIEAGEAMVGEAKDAYSRLRNLSDGAVSRQQLVQARLASEKEAAKLAGLRAEIPRLEAERAQVGAEELTMEATLDELDTAVARAQLHLSRTRIAAPIDGVVLRLHAAPGKKRMLAMDDPSSAVIVELYDPTKLQARIDVPLNEAAALSSGQTVELVSDLLPDRVFEGKVTRISGQADLQRNTLQAKVAIGNPDKRLRPEMLVRAKFFALSGDEGSPRAAPAGRLSIYLPEEALIDDRQAWVVSTESTAELRSLVLGDDSREGHRLVLEGLRSGESVILPPHTGLVEGSRVTFSKIP